MKAPNFRQLAGAASIAAMSYGVATAEAPPPTVDVTTVADVAAEQSLGSTDTATQPPAEATAEDLERWLNRGKIVAIVGGFALAATTLALRYRSIELGASAHTS